MDEPQAIRQFPGFRSPNYTMVPDDLFDDLMAGLSGAELKVLLYIIRRTFGFKKHSDDISLNQICQGIKARNGRLLDRGTGLSRSTVKVALQALLAKSVIVAAHRSSAERGFEATTFRLHIAAQSVAVQDPPGPKIGLAPWAENRPSPGPETSPALGRKSALQETVEQKTDSDGDLRAQPHARSSSRSHRANAGEGHGHQSTEEGQKGATPTPSSTNTPLLEEQVHLVSPWTCASADDHGATTGEAPNQIQVPATEHELIATTHPALVATINALSRELGDDAPPGSSVTRAHTLLQISGLSAEAFLDVLTEAAQRTRAHRATITKRCRTGPGSNAMPYLFTVLRRLPALTGEQPTQASAGHPATRRRIRATGKDAGGTARYTGGAYGVCPHCLCNPCDPDCRTRKEDAAMPTAPEVADSS